MSHLHASAQPENQKSLPPTLPLLWNQLAHSANELVMARVYNTFCGKSSLSQRPLSEKFRDIGLTAKATEIQQSFKSEEKKQWVTEQDGHYTNSSLNHVPRLLARLMAAACVWLHRLWQSTQFLLIWRTASRARSKCTLWTSPFLCGRPTGAVLHEQSSTDKTNVAH